MGGLILPSKRGMSGGLVYPNLSVGRVAAYSAGEQGAGGLVLRDQVGTNHGTLTNGPTWESQALKFNGSSQYVTQGNFIGQPQFFTVAHWIYLTADQNTKVIFSNYTSSSGKGWVTGIKDGTNNVVKFFLGSATNLFSNTVLNSGQWYHVAVTYASGNPKIYIDGLLDNSSSDTITYSGTPGANDIGRLHTGAQYFNGLIDDVNIYSRALSPQEIKQLWNGGIRGAAYEREPFEYEPIRTLSYPNLSKGRVAAYSAGEQGPGGLVLRDQVGANHGTLTNGPTWVNDAGPALSFDGTNDYVAVGDVLSQPNSFSVSFWVQFSADDASTIIIAGYSYPDTGYLIRRSTSAPSDGVNFWLDSGTEDEVSTAANSAVLNTWQHYACTYDGTIASIYLDGDHHESKAIAYVSAASPVGIGLAGGAGVHMEGLLDDINIYKRALSPQEIRQLYNGGIRGAAYEMDGLASPFVTQWGSVADAATFHARGLVIRRSKLVYPDADLVDTASGIWCPSVQRPGGLVLRDLSKHRNDGTISGATWFSRSLDFDKGTSESVVIDAGNSRLDNLAHCTYAVWVKQQTETNYANVLSRSDGTANFGPLIQIRSNANRYRFWIRQSSTHYFAGSTTDPLSRLGLWTHIAATYDGDVIRIYINGIEEGTNSSPSGPMDVVTEPLVIGNASDTPSEASTERFDGELDDARIFPHALKPSQIKRLWAGGQGRGIGLRPSYVEYEPIRTLSYPNLRKGIVSAWGSNPGPLVRDEVGNNDLNLTLTQYSGPVLGVGQSISVPDSTNALMESKSIPTGITNQLTASLWYRLETEDYFGYISGCIASDYGWLFQARGQTSQWRFFVGNGTTTTYAAGPDPVNDNLIWVHLLGTWDGSTIKFYRNGDLVGTQALVGSTCAPTVTVRQGWGHSEHHAAHGAGLYHDSVIWNRVLSGREIQQVWNGGSPDVIREMDGRASPYVTQWGSVADAEAAAFQAAWGANATTVAGIASGF